MEKYVKFEPCYKLFLILDSRKRTTSSVFISSEIFANPVFVSKSCSGVLLRMMYFKPFPSMDASRR